MIGGTLAAFMTACVAGILTSDQELAKKPSPTATAVHEAAVDARTWLVGAKTVADGNNQELSFESADATPIAAANAAAPRDSRERNANTANTAVPHIALQAKLRRPLQILSVANGKRLIVVNRCGSLTMFDPATRKVTAEHEVGSRLTDAAKIDEQHFLVTDDGANRLRLIEVDEALSCHVRRSATIDPGAFSVRVTDDGRRATVASAWAHRLSLYTLEPAQVGGALELKRGRSIDLNFPPRHQLQLNPSTLVVADAFGGWLAKIDLVNEALVRSKLLYGSHNIAGMAMSADGATLFVAHQMLDGNKPTTGPNVHWGDIMSNVVRHVELSWFDSDTSMPATVAPYHYLGFPDRAAGDPGTLLITSRNQFVVAFAGVNELAISENGLASHYQRKVVGRRPSAIYLSSDERTLYVANQFDDSLSIIDATTWQDVQTVSIGPMPELTPTDEGEMLFYDATLSSDGWFSCHSCHTDGHTNGGQSDTFGDTYAGSAKQVPSLLGVRDTYPWAWDGTQQALSAQIEKSIESTMRGAPLSPTQIGSIVLFLETLAPPIPLDVARGATNSAQVARGKHLFREQNCVECHHPASYTSTGVYDVGLRDENDRQEFNPPSLRGVFHRRQLLHDGRASDLREALEVHPNGARLELSDDQWADLEAFLRSI